MPYCAQGDPCLSFWAKAMEEGWIDFPPNARVLEIGCAEADWQTPMLALRPDLQITGIDWRPCVRPGTTVQADVLSWECEPASFDAVVSISAVEHIGLGAYNDDPRETRGDALTMQRVGGWLTPGGWCYLDVPYRANGFVTHQNYRGYDEAALLTRLLPGFEVRKWSVCVTDHPDSPYMAMLLKKV